MVTTDGSGASKILEAASWGISGKARQDLVLLSGTLRRAEADERKRKPLTHAWKEPGEAMMVKGGGGD